MMLTAIKKKEKFLMVAKKSKSKSPIKTTFWKLEIQELPIQKIRLKDYAWDEQVINHHKKLGIMVLVLDRYLMMPNGLNCTLEILLLNSVRTLLETVLKNILRWT